MEDNNIPADRLENINEGYQPFQYETVEEKNKKKTRKKKVFLGIMILCLPLLFSFIYLTLNKRHSIHYPQLNQVEVNPFIYQYLNGTLAFLNSYGNIKVFDNRMNKLQQITEYTLNLKNSKFLMDNWNNQIIINSQDAAQDVEYLDDNSIFNCSSEQSFALTQDVYLLTCDECLFLYFQELKVQGMEFQNFNSLATVLAKQTPIINVFNIIYTSKPQIGNDEILYIYEYDLRDKDTLQRPQLIYQGQLQQLQITQSLKDMIISADQIVMIFSQSIVNYKKVGPVTQDLKFNLEIVDNQSLNIPNSNLKQCFQIESDIICYDINSNSLISINQWQIKDKLQLNNDLTINRIELGQNNDLFILTQIQLMRVTISPLNITETYNFKANGLSDEINDLIVIKN
ncbi:cation channel family protein (macronuclear) [Tetrahymena thermophila SB210]|uniref:Cation channel family protein n=1 Tax=Tetrahymena thermophila (strain SB210) TaxID=312017 RepID=I7LXB0_TETTS|nr:cation channel family protein [Tetrahymena thermophila SB210]EAS04289.2 cation channel family protein [Tetrahymena thermophila SB210]|eukprot:XP_001024534.2 cation channel family protein [Tetrahymena thermophila SB210]